MKAVLMALVMALIPLVLPVGALGAIELPPAGTTAGLGVQIGGYDAGLANASQALLNAAGFKFVRLPVQWNGIEKAKGVYSFGYYDSKYNDCTAHGIHVLFCLMGYGGDTAVYPGSDDYTSSTFQTGFTKFCAAWVAHYKTSNAMYEVWNEPSNSSGPSVMAASTYMNMVNQAIPAMRAMDPSCTIMAPGIGYYYDTGTGRQNSDKAYLTTCCQQGLLNLVDAVSLHMYRGLTAARLIPEAVVSDYANARRVMQTYGCKTVPIVSSEWGYGTSSVGNKYMPWDYASSPQQQGDYLVRSFLVNMSQGIPLSIWYKWTWDNSTSGNSNGIVDVNYVPRPAYNEMQRLTSSLAGKSFSSRLNDGKSSDWLLVFTSPSGEQTLAAWTTQSGGRTVTVPGWGTLQLTGTPLYVKSVSQPSLHQCT